MKNKKKHYIDKFGEALPSGIDPNINYELIEITIGIYKIRPTKSNLFFKLFKKFTRFTNNDR